MRVRPASKEASRPESRGKPREVVQVRRAGLGDLPLLMRHRIAMDCELGRGARKGLLPYKRAYRRWAERGIRSGRLIPFIAAPSEGRPMGSGSIWLREDRPHRGDLHHVLPRIHGIYVEPAARRRGAATALLEAMLRWIRQRGFQRVSLRATPRARALYLRYGFRDNSEMQRIWQT